MTGAGANSRSQGAAVEVSASAVAWTLAAGLFLVLRVAPIWQAPVAGSEFAHLSGAWSAVSGVDDERFIPTLFQALSALLLGFDSSEVWPRLLAFAATCSIPLALFRMRDTIGEGPAFLFLVLLALSANLIGLGASASAYGFDVAITTWVVLAMISGRVALPLVGVLAFLVATAGPLPFAFFMAFGILRLGRSHYPSNAALAAGAIGAVAGVLASSAGFGYGFEGLTVAPLATLSLSLEQDLVSATGWELFVLYTWPIALAGAAGAAYLLWERRSRHTPASPGQARWADLSLVSFGVALAWWLATLGTGTEMPLAALAFASAMVAAIPGARLVEAMLSTDWRRAALPIGIALFCLAITTVVLIDWARFDSGGPAGQLLLAIAAVLAGLALLWAIVRRSPAGDALDRAQQGLREFAVEAWDGDWRNAALAVIGILAVFTVVAFVTILWASGDSTGRRGEAVVVVALLLIALAILAGMLAMPRLRAAAAVVPIAVALVPMLSGATLISVGGPSEPLYSPVSTFQARNLRDIALSLAQESGGPIVVHESLWEDAAWPFRESGDILVASSIPADASVAIWPTSLPAPVDMSELPGPWSLVRTIPPPTSSFLRYVRWYADRNYLTSRAEQVAVYSRSNE